MRFEFVRPQAQIDHAVAERLKALKEEADDTNTQYRRHCGHLLWVVGACLLHDLSKPLFDSFGAVGAVHLCHHLPSLGLHKTNWVVVEREHVCSHRCEGVPSHGCTALCRQMHIVIPSRKGLGFTMTMTRTIREVIVTHVVPGGAADEAGYVYSHAQYRCSHAFSPAHTSCPLLQVVTPVSACSWTHG